MEQNYNVFETIPTSYQVSSKLDTYEYYQFIRLFEQY